MIISLPNQPAGIMQKMKGIFFFFVAGDILVSKGQY